MEVAGWRKSTKSGSSGGDCVEVGDTGTVILVRDTKDRDGEALAFTASAWATFTATLK